MNNSFFSIHISFKRVSIILGTIFLICFFIIFGWWLYNKYFKEEAIHLGGVEVSIPTMAIRFAQNVSIESAEKILNNSIRGIIEDSGESISGMYVNSDRDKKVYAIIFLQSGRLNDEVRNKALQELKKKIFLLEEIEEVEVVED